MRLPLSSFLVLASLLPGQTLVTVPNSAQANVNLPFAGGVGRYQQWHAAWSLQSGFAMPVRLDRIEFFAGLSQSSTPVMIDMEVTLAHGNTLGLNGSFDLNFADTPLVVLPRQNVQLNAGAAGAVVMTIPFASQFTWDHTRSLVIDIKVFGNSNGNQPFTYNNLGTLTGVSAIARCYNVGNANASTGTPQQFVGMVTRLRGRDGFLLDYGAGCPGEGGAVPDNVVQNLPWPGITWAHTITHAASQRPCMWMIGFSNQMAGTQPLPVDVGVLLGTTNTGCMLRQNAIGTLWSTTIGSGPGGGVASISLFLPPVTSYVGMSLYTQWFVYDPNSPSGVLSATEGVWAVVAPIGG